MVVYDQETSVLRTKLLEHGNLVRYAEKLKLEFLEAPSSSSSPPLHSFPSSFSRKGNTHLTLTTTSIAYECLIMHLEQIGYV